MTENRNFEAFIRLLSQNQIHLLDLVSEEVSFDSSVSIYQKFKEEDKPLAVVLRYDNKSEPKIDFQRTIELEPKTEKVNLGILGAGNFASTTILPILKELKKDCQILGIASSTGLSSASLAKTFKIKNKYPTEEEILNADELSLIHI